MRISWLSLAATLILFASGSQGFCRTSTYEFDGRKLELKYDAKKAKLLLKEEEDFWHKTGLKEFLSRADAEGALKVLDSILTREPTNVFAMVEKSLISLRAYSLPPGFVPPPKSVILKSLLNAYDLNPFYYKTYFAIEQADGPAMMPKLELINHVIRLNPKFKKAYIERLCLKVELLKPTEVESDIQNGFDPEDLLSTTDLIETLVSWGADAGKRDALDRAKALVDEIQKQDRTGSQYLQAKLIYLDGISNFRETKKVLAALGKLAGQNREYLYSRLLYDWRVRDSNQCFVDDQQYLEHGGDKSNYHYWRALCLNLDHRLSEADREIQMALKKPTNLSVFTAFYDIELHLRDVNAIEIWLSRPESKLYGKIYDQIRCDHALDFLSESQPVQKIESECRPYLDDVQGSKPESDILARLAEVADVENDTASAWKYLQKAQRLPLAEQSPSFKRTLLYFVLNQGIGAMFEKNMALWKEEDPNDVDDLLLEAEFELLERENVNKADDLIGRIDAENLSPDLRIPFLSLKQKIARAKKYYPTSLKLAEELYRSSYDQDLLATWASTAKERYGAREAVKIIESHRKDSVGYSLNLQTLWAESLVELGRKSDAQKVYEDAIQTHPHSGLLLANFAVFAAKVQKDCSKAKTLAEKAASNTIMGQNLVTGELLDIQVACGFNLKFKADPSVPFGARM